MKDAPKYFYVTTPIYYVNDKPHIGHAYTTLLADVLARYYRLLGVPTFFLTGTDEHGQKVDRAAENNGISPQQQCDETVVRFQELWKKLEITNDDFIRTTEDRHKTVVQEILQDLFDRDEIYKGEYEGWYCVPCERFFTEKDLEDGNCPECKRPVEQITETAYYFRMSKYQDWLIQYINDHPDFIQPDFRRNETLGFLKNPLGDLCVSRPKARLAWGIELPFDPDYVCYVWFDALVNYISAPGYLRDDDRFKNWWPCNYHLIGKDILTTHTVYWPTMLKAMGVDQPQSVFAHGWWLVPKDEDPEGEGEKMSKSTGNVVNPMDLCDKYGVDAFRYFLMAEMTLGHDSTFSEPGFIERYNNDLADNVGNMLSRVLKMIQKNCGGLVPMPAALQAEDDEVQKAVLAAVEAMETSIYEMKINRGLESVIAAVKACNRYFEQTKPWALAKDGSEERLSTVLYTAAEAMRILSGLLYPVIPAKMTTLREALGIPAEEIAPDVAILREWGHLKVGSATQDVKALFPRIEREKKQEQPQPKKGKKGKAPENVVDLIDIKEFFKSELKVACVTAAEAVPDADKLLKLQIQIGPEQRQIVAGIAPWYTPDQVVGRNIVVVANLEPAVIRGIESKGMLLAAVKGKKKLTLITTDDPEFANGASVG